LILSPFSFHFFIPEEITMPSIIFYGYKKCGTSRKAEKDLESRGVAYEFVDITQSPPSLEDLKRIVEQSGKDLGKFYNTSGKKYKELNMKEQRKTLSSSEQMELLAGDGYLLKRPLVSDGTRSTVGYKLEDFDAVWGACFTHVRGHDFQRHAHAKKLWRNRRRRQERLRRLRWWRNSRSLPRGRGAWINTPNLTPKVAFILRMASICNAN
jgi:arsenate reductase